MIWNEDAGGPRMDVFSPNRNDFQFSIVVRGLVNSIEPSVHAESLSTLESVSQGNGTRWSRRRASSGWQHEELPIFESFAPEVVLSKIGVRGHTCR